MNSQDTTTRRRKIPLTSVLLLPFLLVMLVSLLALVLIPLQIEARLAREQLADQMDALAGQQAALLADWTESGRARLLENLDERSEISAAVAELLTGSEAGSRAADYAQARQRFATSAHGLGAPFDQLVLLDASGVVRGSTNPALLNRDLGLEPWAGAALEGLPTGQVMVVGPLRDPVDGQRSLYFTTVVRVEGGASPGVLSGRANVQVLGDLLAAAPVFGQTGEFYLVSAGSQYVVPPRLVEGQTVAADEIIGAALAGQSGSGSWVDYRGAEVIGAYRWVEPLGMAVVLKQDASEALASSRTLAQRQLLIGVLVLVAAAGTAALVARQVTRSLALVGGAARTIAGGDLTRAVPQSRLAEFDDLAGAFNDMTGQLRALTASQEQVIEARTRELAITARMGHVIASETDMDRLLQTTVDMIRDQLGYYHAQVFLLDDLRQNAVLRASMGAAGREMLARAHKLAVGSRSVVGQCTGRGEPVLASDTRQADYWYPNPLLPETRAELAIPLRLGEQIIGALDIQATEPDVFDEATIAVLQTVADQLAVAIRNAQLLDEKENLLSASVDLTQMLTEDSWDSYVARRDRAAAAGFAYDLTEVRPVDGDGAEGDLRLPIALRGAVIGELSARLDEEQALAEDQKQLVEQVLDRVALAIDNARLVEQTQLSLMQTNRLYQATQAIAAASSVDELADVLTGLAFAVDADRAFVLLERPHQEGGLRLAERVNLWTRDEDDPCRDIPEQVVIGQHPLLEGGPALEPVVLHDIDQPPEGIKGLSVLKEQGVRSAAVFPIRAVMRGGTLGWLVIHSTRRANAFSEEDIRFFETVTGQAANALEGLRLFEQTRVRARRLQATNEVSRAASSILDPDILLPLIVDRIGEAFNYYHVQIFLIDEMREWAVLQASTGEVGRELLRRGHRLAVGSRSVIGQVTANGEPVIARDTDADPVHRRNELLPDTRAEMAIPLRTGDRIIGALDVQSTQVDAFDSEAQAILQSLADQIAVTLENAQLFQEIQDRVGELTTVNLVSQVVARTETLDELYDVVTEQIMRQFNTRYGFLGVLDDQEMLHLPIFVEDGERMPSPTPQPIGQGLSGHVIRSRQVLLINENAEDEARRLGARVVGAMPKSVLAAPLMLGDEVVGVLSIQDAEHEHAYNDAHVRQITTLAAYIAVKIRNAELLAETQRRADELSFLFDITRTAVGTADLDEALGNVAGILLREIDGAESAVFYLADPTGQSFEARAAAGYGRDLVARQQRVEAGQGLAGMAAEIGQGILVADLQEEPFNLNSGSRSGAALAVPLRSGPAIIGVMTVESTQPDIFGMGDLQLLEGAAGTLTAVIQNARLLDQITRANEQLRELDKLKSQFLANMSHELRTPLNSIIGFSRVMLKGIDGPLNDLQTQDLTTIYNSGQHLLSLINNILDLSKIEAGKMEIQPEYVALDEIMDSVISTGRGLVKDRPIDIYKEVEQGLPRVYGDAVRIRQILLNLMSNAAKFTKEGSITVRAARKLRDVEAGLPPHVQIDVIDTGIGIAEADMGRLFEAFSQVDGSMTRQVGGTGLGLTISREFVELMGGRIWVTSAPGQGSCFSFTVPLHPPDVPETEVVVGSDTSDGRPVILAVDDEPGVLDLYARYLEKEGYAVIGLNNANDLLTYVRQIRPSAILMDLNLPGKTGWDAIHDLHQQPDTADIPIIICSIEDNREQGQQAGAAEYLIKPVIEQDLLAALGRVACGPAALIRDVVIMDADEAFAEATSAALQETYGCTVRAFPTGFAGLDAISQAKPDVIVMELDLSDMDGYGLLVAMRSQPDLKDVPVVILSARTLTDEQLAYLDEQAACYVSKSTPDRLIDCLPAVLESVSK